MRNYGITEVVLLTAAAPLRRLVLYTNRSLRSVRKTKDESLTLFATKYESRCALLIAAAPLLSLVFRFSSFVGPEGPISLGEILRLNYNYQLFRESENHSRAAAKRATEREREKMSCSCAVRWSRPSMAATPFWAYSPAERMLPHAARKATKQSIDSQGR